MKKIIWYMMALNLVLIQEVKSQLFEFPLFFKDAAGNRDTIIIGSHYLAKSGVDTAFGEVNVINQPFKEGLDVRITDEYYSSWSEMPATFHLKREIAPAVYPPISIDIRCKNFPVTAYWDKTLFTDTIWKGSLFTSFNPGGWWDVLSGNSNLGVVFFKDLDSITFTKNTKGLYVEHAGYIKNNDTVEVYWIALGPEGIGVGTSESFLSSIYITPNPVADFFTISGLPQNQKIDIELWNMRGELVLSKEYTPDDRIDISHFHPGMYICRMTDGQNVVHKTLVTW